MLEQSRPFQTKTSAVFRVKVARSWRGEPLAFFLVFSLGLLFFLVQLFSWAIPRILERQKFVPHQAIVVATQIREEIVAHNAENRATIGYRPEIWIDFTVNNTPYHVLTFDFQTLTSTKGFFDDKSHAEQALESFPVGKEVRCWYREDDPTKAVLVWHFPIFGGFLLLLSFSFVILGIVGFMQSFRRDALSPERKTAAAGTPTHASLLSLFSPQTSSDWPTVPDDSLINESPGIHLAFRLPLGNQPLFPLVGIMFLTLAVNAVAWGVMVHSFFHAEQDMAEWIFGTVFRVLFCGIGAVLLIGLIRRLVVAFRQGPTLLEISDHPLYPGRRYRILLQQSGLLRFFSFSVDLVCEEISRFRQGTDTVTNRKDVFRQNLFIRNDFEITVSQPLSQEFFIQLPLGAMHSLRLENNEVLWKLEIAAKIAGWPDILRECPIIVRPGTLSDHTMDGEALEVSRP